MKSKANKSIQRAEKLTHFQGEGPNWVLIVGGALLSTLSVRLGCKLKQALDTKRHDTAGKENRNLASKRSGACKLHSNRYQLSQDEDACYECLSGISGGVDMKQPKTPVSKVGDDSLPLVKFVVADPSKDCNGGIWTSSPDRLELPRKPFHRSNSSDSPCMSESGSDIYSKREVIQKLRQQLKRRDEMIMEMQAQITDLQNSINIQMKQSAHLQAQVDAANRDLFDSMREIQRLRKVIADHCAAEVASPDKPARNWHQENGFMNCYPDSVDDLDLHCVGVEKGKIEGEKIDMLKREIEELKEVIGGKDFLLQSYKEQKVELSSKVKELQQKLSWQVPNIFRGAATVGLPPAWVDVSEEIASNVARARSKMSELAKAHSKALMPSFGDDKENHRTIEILSHEITDLLKRSEKRLQKLSSGEPSEDSNVRKNVQRSMATDLQSLSMEFRKKQSSYLKRLRQQSEGQDSVDLEMNLNGFRSELDQDDDFGNTGFTEHQMSKLKKSEAFTKEREREIEQVVESVNELAQIMKDLSVLVIDQGTIVDRIDYNVQNVSSSVEEGFKQLEKAERTQKKGGMVMCATVLVIMCFVMLILLILKTILF